MSTASSKKYPFLLPPEKEGEIGRLGSYRVLGLIGEGGMGQVFLAEDKRLQREVALKVMSPRIAANERSRLRFIREARAQAAVHHDNVATIFEVGEKNNTPFLAMELLKGQSLERILQKGHRFSHEEIMTLSRHVARGLDAAHKKGIIHRDIKPANIWIERQNGRPKILDFGLAALAGPADSLARRGAVVGTPGYLAPEQARDEPVDDRADIYSLGIVIYEMCSGRLPFRAENIALLLIQIAAHVSPSLKSVAPHVPQELSDLVGRMLAKEPRNRPSSAASLVDELKHIANGLSFSSTESSESVSFSFDSFDSAAAASPLQPVPSAGPANSLPSYAAATKPERRKAIPIATIIGGSIAASLLFVVGATAIFLKNPFSDTASNAYSSSNNSTEKQPNQSSVTIAGTDKDLGQLKIEGRKPEATIVAAGKWAKFPYTLRNLASSDKQDPRITASKDRVVAIVRAVVKPKSGKNSQGLTLYRNRLEGKQLPTRKSPLKAIASFDTQTLAKGDYVVAVKLFKPDNTMLTEFESSLSIVDQNSPLLPKPKSLTIRTHTGNGADLSLGRGKRQKGNGKTLVIHNNGKKRGSLAYAYLKFDLTSWTRPFSELKKAVVMMHLRQGPDASQNLQLYGVPSTAMYNWMESGNKALTWDLSPTANGTDKLELLAESTANGVDPATEDNVQFKNSKIAEFIRRHEGLHVTFVVVRSSAHETSTNFTAKEMNAPSKSPGLFLSIDP